MNHRKKLKIKKKHIDKGTKGCQSTCAIALAIKDYFTGWNAVNVVSSQAEIIFARKDERTFHTGRLMILFDERTSDWIEMFDDKNTFGEVEPFTLNIEYNTLKATAEDYDENGQINPTFAYRSDLDYKKSYGKSNLPKLGAL